MTLCGPCQQTMHACIHALALAMYVRIHECIQPLCVQLLCVRTTAVCITAVCSYNRCAYVQPLCVCASAACTYNCCV